MHRIALGKFAQTKPGWMKCWVSRHTDDRWNEMYDSSSRYVKYACAYTNVAVNQIASFSVRFNLISTSIQMHTRIAAQIFS